jgi:hypothetical protein
MIGMDFHEFLVLLILSFIASMVVHYQFQHRHREGFRCLPVKVAGGLDRGLDRTTLTGPWWFRVQGAG